VGGVGGILAPPAAEVPHSSKVNPQSVCAIVRLSLLELSVLAGDSTAHLLTLLYHFLSYTFVSC